MIYLRTFLSFLFFFTFSFKSFSASENNDTCLLSISFNINKQYFAGHVHMTLYRLDENKKITQATFINIWQDNDYTNVWFLRKMAMNAKKIIAYKFKGDYKKIKEKYLKISREMKLKRNVFWYNCADFVADILNDIFEVPYTAIGKKRPHPAIPIIVFRDAKKRLKKKKNFTKLEDKDLQEKIFVI